MTCGIQSYTYRIQRSVCHALIFRFQRKIRYHYTIRPHFQIENLKKTDKFESVVEFTSSYRIYFSKSATHGFIRNFFTDHIFVQSPTIYGILYSVDKTWTFVHIEKLPKIL